MRTFVDTTTNTSGSGGADQDGGAGAGRPDIAPVHDEFTNHAAHYSEMCFRAWFLFIMLLLVLDVSSTAAVPLMIISCGFLVGGIKFERESREWEEQRAAAEAVALQARQTRIAAAAARRTILVAEPAPEWASHVAGSNPNIIPGMPMQGGPHHRQQQQQEQEQEEGSGGSAGGAKGKGCGDDDDNGKEDGDDVYGRAAYHGGSGSGGDLFHHFSHAVHNHSRNMNPGSPYSTASTGYGSPGSLPLSSDYVVVDDDENDEGDGDGAHKSGQAHSAREELEAGGWFAKQHHEAPPSATEVAVAIEDSPAPRADPSQP